jgi:hypothetical protein
VNDWEYVHIDEVRAFLNASYKGATPVYARLAKDQRYFRVSGALYGLKTSPRDYNAEVVQRLKLLDFTQLHSCSCLYVKRQNNHVIIIFDFVDDFIVTGDCKLELELFVRQFRDLVTTTPAVWNSDRVLGMVLVRNRSRRTIEINMTHKIEEVCRDNN